MSEVHCFPYVRRQFPGKKDKNKALMIQIHQPDNQINVTCFFDILNLIIMIIISKCLDRVITKPFKKSLTGPYCYIKHCSSEQRNLNKNSQNCTAVLFSHDNTLKTELHFKKQLLDSGAVSENCFCT